MQTKQCTDVLTKRLWRSSESKHTQRLLMGDSWQTIEVYAALPERKVDVVADYEQG